MAEMSKPKGGARSAARLAAVQALYQVEASNTRSAVVIHEFSEHRLGKEIDECHFANADKEFFADIVSGVEKRAAEIDDLISESLSNDWTLKRIESVARAALRAGTYEIIARPDVPSNVIVNEYVDLTKAFFDDTTPGFVNGVLDKMAKRLR